jgi:hypothetical protein
VDDAVTVLSRQYAGLRRLMREIKAQPRIGDGANGRKLRHRQELIDKMRRCFVIHERAKQRYLWPVLRRAWPDGDGIACAARQRRRHVDERFIKYRWLSERDVHAEEVIDEALAGIEEHLSLEDHLLGRIHRGLPEEVREQIGAKLATRQFLVPTRPHPDMPTPPWAAAVTGPVLGVVDRMVEAVSFGPSGA